VSELLPLPDLPELERETSYFSRLLQQDVATTLKSNKRLFQLLERLPTYFFHSEHAEFRLKGIYNKYQLAHACYSDVVDDLDEREFASEELKGLGEAILWDFQAFLSSLTTAVDLLHELTESLNSNRHVRALRAEVENLDHNPMQIFSKADKRWIRKLKKYCLSAQRYPLFDQDEKIGVARHSDGWELRIKLPTNPESAGSGDLRFSRRNEVLRFALNMFKCWRALDAALYRHFKVIMPSSAELSVKN